MQTDQNNLVHSSSIIDPSAKIADDVEIGPFCLVGADVEIGSGTQIESHVILKANEDRREKSHISIFYSG